MNQDCKEQAKILVIDDDEISAELLKTKLDALGYEVTIALTAEQGIAADSKIRPHLILLDVVLPEMSGFEVCRKLIERHKDNRYVPIILVTGMNDVNAKIRGLESGGIKDCPAGAPPRETARKDKSGPSQTPKWKSPAWSGRSNNWPENRPSARP